MVVSAVLCIESGTVLPVSVGVALYGSWPFEGGTLFNEFPFWVLSVDFELLEPFPQAANKQLQTNATAINDLFFIRFF